MPVMLVKCLHSNWCSWLFAFFTCSDNMLTRVASLGNNLLGNKAKFLIDRARRPKFVHSEQAEHYRVAERYKGRSNQHECQHEHAPVGKRKVRLIFVLFAHGSKLQKRDWQFNKRVRAQVQIVAILTHSLLHRSAFWSLQCRGFPK